jgi:multidrug efflux pump
MARLQAEVAASLKADPDVATVTSVIGAGIVNPAPNTGRLTVVLTPREGRGANAEAIVRRLRARLAGRGRGGWVG